MRVLVFCDDTFHPAATVRAGLESMAGGEFSFDWVENAAGWNPVILQGYSMVLLSKSNVCSHDDKTPWLTERIQVALRDFVRNGGDVLAVHSGTASYKDMPMVRGLLGGVFASHPEPCAVTMEPVAGHPLVEGVGSFTVHDEHYQMIMDDPGVEIFLHSHSSHGVQPAGWIRPEGRGHVIVLTPGHFVAVWQNPSFQQILRKCLGIAQRRSAGLHARSHLPGDKARS